MSVKNSELTAFLNELLKPHMIRDFCPNGLQVEGKHLISKIVTGVTASQDLIDQAIQLQADAIFVHHGFFWKGENQTIQGMKKNRIKALLENDINLYAYHLPLDIHPILGNNAQLANLLGIQIESSLDRQDPNNVAMRGTFPNGISLNDLANRVSVSLQREPLVISGGDHLIHSIAWCTGGGQGYIDQAAQLGIDAFVSGEASEQTVHSARELNIHFIAAGHHATERYGAKAVGQYLAEHLDVKVEFIDIDNPV